MRTGDARSLSTADLSGRPLAGAEPALIGTTQHSVRPAVGLRRLCGSRVRPGVGPGDRQRGPQADLDVVTDSGYERRPPTTKVLGSGNGGRAVPVVGPVTCAHDGTRTVCPLRYLQPQCAPGRWPGCHPEPSAAELLEGTCPARTNRSCWPGLHSSPHLAPPDVSAEVGTARASFLVTACVDVTARLMSPRVECLFTGHRSPWSCRGTGASTPPSALRPGWLPYRPLTTTVARHCSTDLR